MISRITDQESGGELYNRDCADTTSYECRDFQGHPVSPCRENIIYSRDRILSMKGYPYSGHIPNWWFAIHPRQRRRDMLRAAPVSNVTAKPHAYLDGL